MLSVSFYLLSDYKSFTSLHTATSEFSQRMGNEFFLLCCLSISSFQAWAYVNFFLNIWLLVCNYLLFLCWGLNHSVNIFVASCFLLDVFHRSTCVDLPVSLIHILSQRESTCMSALCIVGHKAHFPWNDVLNVVFRYF